METTLTTPRRSARSSSVAYWIVTGLLAFGMTAGAIAQLLYVSYNVIAMQHLGYPAYMLRIIGCWKLLGVLVLLLPGRLMLKEWAYAGFFFLLTGAFISHLVMGEGPKESTGSLMFACLTVASWYLRPASRRLPSSHA